MSLRNLIVNYLPADTTEDELKKMFQMYGPVSSAKIVKNKQTGQSLCYGFVIMLNDDDSQMAIEGLNQKQLRGKTLRVSFAKDKESLQKSDQNTNLYITGVSPTVDSTILEKTFSKYGPIVSTHIVKNQDPTQKGVAFVKYFERADAEKALEDLNNKALCVKSCEENNCQCADVLTIKFAIPSSAKFQKHILTQVRSGGPVQYQGMPVNLISALPPAQGALAQTTLPNYGYATGHLQTFITPTTINSYFAPAQPYMQQYPYPYAMYTNPNASAMYTNPNASAMYANPNASAMYTNQSTNTMYQTQNPMQGTYPPQVPAMPMPVPLPASVPVTATTAGVASTENAQNLAIGSHCVFVYGLSQATTEEELQALFLPYGAISNCRLAYDLTDGKRSCKGYGFVNFYSFNDAQLAIAGLNNFTYKSQLLQVRFKSSKSSK